MDSSLEQIQVPWSGATQAPYSFSAMPYYEHPHPAELERFMRGESALDEKCAVVRHLLAGCPHCVQLTGPLWRLGAKPPAKTLLRSVPALKAGAGGSLQGQTGVPKRTVVWRRKGKVA